MVDYSKWDRLELSDDSDIEVHPNVDKRSFIRAKQRMIHEERQKRKQQIEDLTHQRTINDELLRRINLLKESLQNNTESAISADEKIFKSMIEIAVTSDDKPPGLAHYKQAKSPPQPTYAQMMAALVDQIKKEVDESKTTDRYKGFIDALNQHHVKLTKLQADALTELKRLEKEEASKITSENIHDGFNTGFVNKSTPAPVPEKNKAPTKVTAVEQINPNAKSQNLLKTEGVSSGAEGDIEEGGEDDSEGEGGIKPTALGIEFSKIKIGDYRKCLEFISTNPSVVAEKEENGLLIEAFNQQTAGKDEYAQQCVHQALLLQYCRQLGPDGVGLFFKRITMKGHQAQQVFHKDVRETYEKLRHRARELAAERENNPEGAGVETIQLQAVEPGTSINIQVPPPNSEDPEVQQARTIFESFPPGLQRALESGQLEEVNKVLGKMSVEEAEEVVEKLGEGGMLSLEQGVIDGTTPEGRAQIEELERLARERK
ncbi:hypothetical protein DFH27DRAFT_468025, partial [Peziza echinospora]